jgi:hypothetical protein
MRDGAVHAGAVVARGAPGRKRTSELANRW